MAKRGSLVSSDFESIGRKRSGGGSSGGGGPSTQDKIKIGVAAALLLFAGFMLAYHFGFFDRRIPADYEPPPPEVIAEIEEQQRHYEELIETGAIAAPGAD